MEKVFKNNMFVYGEVGERLSGIRESEIYQQSAQGVYVVSIKTLYVPLVRMLFVDTT